MKSLAFGKHSIRPIIGPLSLLPTMTSAAPSSVLATTPDAMVAKVGTLTKQCPSGDDADLTQPTRRVEDLADQLADVAHIIAASRESVIGYCVTIDDLQAQFQALSDDHKHLQTVINDKSDQVASIRSEVEGIWALYIEEHSEKEVLRDVLTQRTAELAAVRTEKERAQSALLVMQNEARHLAVDLQKSRLGKDELRSSSGRSSVSAASDVSSPGQHWYCLRPRKNSRLRRRLE
jgi:chromosome segregation ATPase